VVPGPLDEEPVFAHSPPANLHTMALQGQPRRDIGFMIHFTDYDLFALPQSVGQSQAHDPDKRRRIMRRPLPVGRGRSESGNTFASVAWIASSTSWLLRASTALHVCASEDGHGRHPAQSAEPGLQRIVEKNEFVSGMRAGNEARTHSIGKQA